MSTNTKLSSLRFFAILMFGFSVMFHLVAAEEFFLYGNVMLTIGIVFLLIFNFQYAQLMQFKFDSEDLLKFLIRLSIVIVGDLVGRFWFHMNFPMTMIPVGIFLMLYAAYLRNKRQKLEMYRF